MRRGRRSGEITISSNCSPSSAAATRSACRKPRSVSGGSTTFKPSRTHSGSPWRISTISISILSPAAIVDLDSVAPSGRAGSEVVRRLASRPARPFRVPVLQRHPLDVGRRHQRSAICRFARRSTDVAGHPAAPIAWHGDHLLRHRDLRGRSRLGPVHLRDCGSSRHRRNRVRCAGTHRSATPGRLRTRLRHRRTGVGAMCTRRLRRRVLLHQGGHARACRLRRAGTARTDRRPAVHGRQRAGDVARHDPQPRRSRPRLPSVRGVHEQRRRHETVDDRRRRRRPRRNGALVLVDRHRREHASRARSPTCSARCPSTSTSRADHWVEAVAAIQVSYILE